MIDGDDTRWENVVGCFLLPLIRPYLQLPYLARESELETLKLPADRKVPFMRCQEGVYDQVRPCHAVAVASSSRSSHSDVEADATMISRSSSVQKILDYSLRTMDNRCSFTRKLDGRRTFVERSSSSTREWSCQDSRKRSRKAVGMRLSSSGSRLVSRLTCSCHRS